MKQTEKEYKIRVVTTEEMHSVIKDKLNEIYQNIKNGMPNVLDVEYYVKSKIADMEN